MRTNRIAAGSEKGWKTRKKQCQSLAMAVVDGTVRLTPREYFDRASCTVFARTAGVCEKSRPDGRDWIGFGRARQTGRDAVAAVIGTARRPSRERKLIVIGVGEDSIQWQRTVFNSDDTC